MRSPAVAREFSMPIHDKYEVEDAARTMERHAEIKSKPSLHRAAKRHIAKKIKNLSKVMKSEKK